MKYQFGLQILVLAFAVSCIKVKKKDEALQKSETVQTDKDYKISAVTTSNLNIKYEGQSRPNVYSAEISWPESSIKSTYRIIQSGSEAYEFTENLIQLEDLVGGQESKFIFEQYSIAEQKRLASFEVFLNPPKDFVFDGVISLQQNIEENVERLFFTSTAKVYTNQFNLRIKAKNIYSEFGAVLSNFTEGSVAPLETVGLSGGRTEISAEFAEGNLQIVMNAQRGGSGKLGAPASTSLSLGGLMTDPQSTTIPKCHGSNGSDSGVSGSFFLSLQNGQNFQLATRMKIMSGGLFGDVDEKCINGTIYLSKIHPEYLNLCNLEGYNYANRCSRLSPSIDGQQGKPGQICTKMSSTENYKCEKF